MHHATDFPTRPLAPVRDDRLAARHPRPLAQALRQSRRPVVFTGAGVSAESGIATFRDALTGLWSRFDAQALATPEAFRAHPDLVWGWYEWRREQALRARPNAAHLAIARLAAHAPALTVITQNVDDLHERAGSRKYCICMAACTRRAAPIAARPGAAPSPRALTPRQPAQRQPIFGQPTPRPPARRASGAPNGEQDEGRRIEPPRCAACGGPVRPGVVWFGESLPADAWRAAQLAAEQCDLLLSIGTSALVYPAAELPQRALAAGAVVAQVNPAATPMDARVKFNLRGQAADVLPRLLQSAGI